MKSTGNTWSDTPFPLCRILSNFRIIDYKVSLDRYYVTHSFHISIVENSVEVVENPCYTYIS